MRLSTRAVWHLFLLALRLLLPSEKSVAQSIIPLIPANEVILPQSTGQWSAVALFDGRVAIASAHRDTLAFCLTIGGPWQSALISGLVLHDLAAEAGNTVVVLAQTDGTNGPVIERIPLPAANRGDVIANWLNASGYAPYGGYWYIRSNYFEASCYPVPPRLARELRVEGHTSSYSYSLGSASYDRILRRYSESTWREDTLLFGLQRAIIPDLANLKLTDVLWQHSNAEGWRYTVQTKTVSSDESVSILAHHSSIINYPMTSPANIGSRGTCTPLSGNNQRIVVLLAQLAGGHADTLIAIDPAREGLYWSRPGVYQDVFAVDLIPYISGQEVACLDTARHCLDIWDAQKGQLIAVTTPFEGNPMDIKILGPEDPDFCYLAVRDGQLLRFYRFGTPTTGDVTDFNGSLPDRAELRISPEPVRGMLHLELSTPLPTQATLVIYNILGREIARQNLSASVKSATMHLESQATGIYFARLENQPQIHTKKFVLIH